MKANKQTPQTTENKKPTKTKSKIPRDKGSPNCLTSGNEGVCVKQASCHTPGHGRPVAWCPQALTPPAGEAQGTLHGPAVPHCHPVASGNRLLWDPARLLPACWMGLRGAPSQSQGWALWGLGARRGTRKTAEACLKVEPGAGRAAGPVREAGGELSRQEAAVWPRGRGTGSRYRQQKLSRGTLALFTPISENFVNMMDNSLGCVRPIKNMIPRSISPCNCVCRICVAEKKHLTFMLSNRYIFFDDFWGFQSLFERFTKAVPSYFKFYSLTFPLKIVLYFTVKSFNLPRTYFWAMQWLGVNLISS